MDNLKSAQAVQLAKLSFCLEASVCKFVPKVLQLILPVEIVQGVWRAVKNAQQKITQSVWIAQKALQFLILNVMQSVQINIKNLMMVKPVS